MILEKLAVEQLLGKNHYECELLKQQISYRILHHQTDPVGNIFCFETPLTIGSLICENSLVFAAELANMSMFSSICFQRLFAAELGSLLTHLTKQDHYTDGTSIFSTKSQIGIMLSNKVKETATFHVIFPLTLSADVKDSFGIKCLDLQDEALNTFKVTACEIFNSTLHNIHLDSRRDYI